MTLDLFAGLPVTEYAAALPWYEKLLGGPPSFHPTDTEAVWELAEHRFVYIVELPQRAGYGVLTLFVDDLDRRVAGIGDRGIEPSQQETYGNGVRKVTYRGRRRERAQLRRRPRVIDRRGARCPRSTRRPLPPGARRPARPPRSPAGPP
jgi:hypothetical protein